MAGTAPADWRQFRGNDTTGVVEGPRWSGEQNIAWSAELPGRGLSSPIVVGKRVFVTSSSGPRQDRLHVLCFDQESGSLLWERQFWATGRTATNPKTCVAAPSPVSDGKRVIGFYSSGDLVCLDLDGNLQWYRGLGYDYPNASNSLGMASSPVVVGETVVVMMESDDDSFSAGIDTATGTTRWKVERPQRANWTSPGLIETAGGSSRVLLQSSAGVSSIDPETGTTYWTYDKGAATIPSMAVSGATAYVPSHGITALASGRDASGPPDILWNRGYLSPAFSSPIVLEDELYVLNSAGVLTCASTRDGERLWQLRLSGPFSSTPVALGGKLYFVSEEGLAQVVDPAEKGRVVSTHGFGETILSTPAVDRGAIFVRSDGHLWKVGAAGTQ